MSRTARLALAACLLAPAALRAQSLPFSASSTNTLAAPLTLGFTFTTVVPSVSYSSVTIAGALTLTAGQTATSVSPTTGVPFYIQAFGLQGATTTLLGGLGTITCTVPIGSTSTVCDFGTTLQTFAPGIFDGLEVRLRYSQTGIQSQAAWSGRATLGNATANVVPEPATFALLAPALLALGGVAARRRRVSP